MKKMPASLLVVALCTAISTIADGQDLPRRATTLVVPYAAGGVIDQITRLLASKVADRTGQAVVVENRPGGGGQIAAGAVKQAQANGSTILVGDIGTHAINASLYGKLSYDPVKDFVPITELVEMPHVLVIPPESPFTTMNDLLAGARKTPKSLTYASVGVGSGAHLLGEMLRSEYKIDIVHAPYRGSSQIVPDLIANRVALFFGAVGSMASLIEEGKVRALMVTDQKRSSLLPNIPSAIEAGTPALDLKVWFGLLAPMGTPATTVDQLNKEFVNALDYPEIKQRLMQWGANVIANSPTEFAAVMAADSARLGKVVRAAGARVD
jgi:tripartite-type tricarboxylate transporter receptor subunit TctC